MILLILFMAVFVICLVLGFLFRPAFHLLAGMAIIFAGVQAYTETSDPVIGAFFIGIGVLVFIYAIFVEDWD